MNNTFIKIILLLLLILSISSARTHEQRANDYLHAVEHAKATVKKFKEAIKTRDPAKIKKATLEIQEDPAAIKELNKESNFVKKKFVETTDSIQTKTIENIKKNYAKQYNKKHPEAKIRAEDVKVKKFTNPSSEIKAGHDWDVTVSVKGKDVPFREVEGVVHKSYYDAAGGKKAYPDSNPKNFAEAHHVEVTSKGHAEAYEGGKKYIDNPGEHRVKDPERLSKTIEHKSDREHEKVKEYTKNGEFGKAEVSKHERARQYTKQYDKHIKPRIKEMGGRIPEKVREGTDILKKIGKPSKKLGRIYTPDDADADLAKMGETTESIIKKGSALVESGQKIKRPSKETRLKERLRESYKDIVDAQGAGKTKKVKKLRRKIAKTKAELKQIQSEPTSKNPSSEEPLPGKTGKVSGAAAAEEGTLTKGSKAAGKLMETAGAGAVIFNTAQDVKESLQGKKSWKETGKNVADLTTGGAISTTENTIKKNSDYKDSEQATKKAQASENEAEILSRGLSLRKNGVSKEETQKIMEEMRQGNNKNFYHKVHELRKQGKIIPLGVARHVDTEGPDDTYKERAEEVKEGLIKYGKRAGKFVGQAGKDVLEIGKSSVETQKNIYKAYKGNKEAETQLEKIKKRLIKEGVSPEGAQIAIDRYKDGHKETLGHVIKKLNEAKLKKLKEGYRQKQNKLIKMGASEMEAAKALAGKSGSVNKLIKKLHDRKEKAEKEERREKVAKREKEKKLKIEAEAKALIEKSDEIDKEDKAKAAIARLKEKIAQSKKEELLNKAKTLLTQAKQVDEAEAARERLREKIAQSKKEELSDKAKALLTQAKQVDENEKLAEQNRKNHPSTYKRDKNMTQHKQHKVLKKNSDEAMRSLEKVIDVIYNTRQRR